MDELLQKHRTFTLSVAVGGLVFLLAVMLRVRHPQPEHMEPLGTARIVVGIITLIVFALCFLPFPITIGW